MKFSIIIPVLNESARLDNALRSLQTYRDQGHQVIVVDGGSSDTTRRIAAVRADVCLEAEQGRAIQMNAGAHQATGEVLLFLHADTVLPENALQKIQAALQNQADGWGCFNVRLRNPAPVFRLISGAMNWRSRLTSVSTGDQCLFVGSELFWRIGGFPPIPLMEDIAISKLLRRVVRPVRVAASVTTSSRRWEDHGVLKTILLMWWLRLLFVAGVSPEKLVRIYYR